QAIKLDRAGDQPFMIAYRQNFRAVVIKLVANLAEQLFEQVFECDQAEHAPIFVDYHRELKAPAAHLVEQFAEGPAGRNKIGWAHQPFEPRRDGFKTSDHDIFDMQQSDDIVGLAAIDRYPR